MPTHMTRLATVALLLPAVGIGVRTPHANFVRASCTRAIPPSPPHAWRTRYTAAGKPARRAKASLVEVFQRGQTPPRRYEVVGEVQVLATSSRTSVDQLTDYAIRGARTLGGDVIVGVSVCDAGSAHPKAGTSDCST